MNIIATNFDGLFEIENKVFEDKRGGLVKTFHFDTFIEYGLETDFREHFYSASKKNVLRGMHFQRSPCEHAKLVYVIEGEILDVTLDIRKNSNTFGKYFTTKLSEENLKSLYIGKGFAHGFLTLSKSAKVVYLTTTVHNYDLESGIHWDSFGFDWNVKNPIISERDADFASLNQLSDV